jgi:predicted AlkP superfamily pyrophosphatase or phosphodiesterase
MSRTTRSTIAKSLSMSLGLWLAACAAAWAEPRLGVVIFVDQMRASYLTDFADDYRRGLGRLLTEGAVFERAYHDHALTETSPGHSTIVTGVYPARHGVVGNDIWDREQRELIGVVLDDDSAMVGTERRSGRSPYRLTRSAVGDWLREQSPRSRVFAIAGKDRTAVFAGGLHPDAAYWYDERGGGFVTSTYYRSELPDWLQRFNGSAPADAYFGKPWLRLLPDAHYAPVGTMPSYSAFPHPLSDAESPDRRFYTELRTTPFVDQLTLKFAMALIDAEVLGSDASTDLLMIGLSASDYIGHRYGPWSDEVHDHYARLDGYLGEFLEWLDARLGRDAYLVVLTADHGGMPVPERMAARGIDAERLHWDELLAFVEPVVTDAHRRGVIPSVPTLRYEFGVIFDFGTAAVTDAQTDALAEIVARKLEEHPFVAAVRTRAQLRAIDPESPGLDGLYARSFYADRAPDVIPYIKENYLLTDRLTGTTHVSPHDYDRHVPLIVWGDGIPPGRIADPVRTVDIAPTVATLVGIAAPVDLDGRDLGALLSLGR